jgi:lipid-binding SYLF domain-containing protein
MLKLIKSFVFIFILFLNPWIVFADTAVEIDSGVDAALLKLFNSSHAAKTLAPVAKGILVYPDVLKAGLVLGGQYGEGALRIDGKTTGYYNTVAASYGLQAGVQSFGYAMYFMNDEALAYVNKSDGWEVGFGPSIVVVDEGAASSLTTTSAKDDIYVFFFDQKGLMAGLGIQGSKITRITPE